MKNMPPELKQAILRTELYAFFVRAMQDILPGGNYQHNWHIQAMCAAIEEMIKGENKRLIINIQPRMAKSLLCSVALPMFLLMSRPATQIMCLSYAESLASEFHQKCRMLAQEAWYKTLNPHLNFKAAGRDSLLKSSEDVLQTNELGQRMALSLNGSITGKGADWMILDDPNDMGQMASRTHRDKINGIFDTALANRLNDKDGRILLVSQRGHSDDLSGHLLAKGGFKLLRIEAEATEDQEYNIGKAGIYYRKKGELIQPGRFGATEIAERRRDLGSAAFEAQYQQNPQPPEGTIFKRTWIKWVKDLPEFQYVVITGDIAQTYNGGDYSAFIVWGYQSGNWYVLHVYRMQHEIPSIIKSFEQLNQKHEPDFVVIESNGPGKGFCARLRELGCKHVNGTTVSSTKEVRASNIVPLLEQGKVLFSQAMTDREPFMEELLSFPSSRYDDWVDAFTLLLNHRDGALRMADRFRRERRQHLPKHGGASLKVKVHPIRRPSSGDRYFDRTGISAFRGRF